jgi:hypothetical protein
MIRQLEGRWFICYDADGAPFDGPFASSAIAQKRMDGLRAVDRMLVSGQAPASRTDREFLMGSENGRQFQNRPEAGNRYKQITESHGVSVVGKKYLSSLARFPGDPEAWVSGRGDAQRVLEKRGWASEGMVNVKMREPEGEPKEAHVAEDILERETKVEAAKHGKVSAKKREEIKETVRSKRTPKWKR